MTVFPRARAVTAVLAGTIGAVLLTGCSADPPDAELVYCLSPARAPVLVESARALGLAEPGAAPLTLRPPGAATDLTVPDWRAQRADDFARSCAAVQPRGGAPAGGANEWTTGLLAVLNVAVGAGLALASTAWGQRRQRRQQAADALELAARRLDRALADQLAARDKRDIAAPTRPELLDRVDAVRAAVRGARAELGRGSAPADLPTRLDALADRLPRVWPPGEAGTRLADELATAAARLRTDTDALVTALLAAPWRRTASRSTAGSGSGAGSGAGG